jgi:hypothetical protein
MPGTLLNQPTELPALLTHFDSPVASPSGSPLFLWERLTEKDVRYTDRSVQSPRLRKLRNLWLDSFNRAVFPGCELEQIEESDRTRFRVQIQKQIAISQLSGFKERSVTSPETPPR